MSRTVLIVEDSPQMASNLEVALMGLEGVEIEVVPSAIDALRVLGSTPRTIAAIITDLEMPKMDGFELIRRLRALPKYAHTPVIVSSGSPDPDSPRRAQALGADAYFTKPYSPAALRRKLECLLAENRNA